MYLYIPSLMFFFFVLFSNSPAQTFTRITSSLNPIVTDQFESGGGSWADVNNDGWLDLFVANGNLTSQNNSLYINLRNGNFSKVFTGSVVNDGGSSIGGTFADYNNDGNLDLFVTNRNFFKNFLYSGNGDSTFIKITAGNIVGDSGNSNCGHWVDIDKDGDLDLHVINFQGNDYLYLNSGAPLYMFTKIDTAAFLLDGSAFSIAAVWCDYNNDRYPDLFVGNAGNQNDIIYKNNGNMTFTPTALTDARSTLGASWGDYDNDGDMDLFVANFLGQNNFIYKNNGAPNYTFTRIDTGIVSNDGGNSVGSCWGDVDNDGDLDLFVANDNNENDYLYINSGAPDHSFTKVNSGAVVSSGGSSFGCTFGDYENDGDIDLFVANRLNQNNFLYSNNGNSNNWLSVKCKGTASGNTAIGTKVRIKATINGIPIWQTREVAAQTGYNSQNLILNFGFGNAATIDSIRVEWTSGTTSHFTNRPVNQMITINETGTAIGVVNNVGAIPSKYILHQNYPNPFNPTTSIKFEIPGYSNVELQVHDISGKEISKLISEEMNPGTYSITWNGESFPSGIYFYTLTSNGIHATKKMLLIK